MGTYAPLTTLSNTVSTQQASTCKSVRLSVRPSNCPSKNLVNPTLFRSSDFVIFGLEAFRCRVSCERNYSYSFNRIFLKLGSWFCQCLKMCMTLAVILGLMFVHFFSFVMSNCDVVTFPLLSWVRCGA